MSTVGSGRKHQEKRNKRMSRECRCRWRKGKETQACAEVIRI